VREDLVRPLSGKYQAVEKGYGTHFYSGDGLNPTEGSDFRITTNDSIAKVNIDFVSQAETAALNKLLTEGRALQGTWSAAQAWGERRETAELLTRTAQRVVGLFRALRSGQWRKLNELLPIGERKRWKELKDTPYGKWLVQRQRRALAITPQAMASGVLEFQNGWKPLLGDVYNACEMLANRKMQADWVITGRGETKRFDSRDEILGQDTPWYVNPRTRRYWECTRLANVRIDATVDDQFFHRLSQMGMTNPFATAWELLPLTYIADWFVGIGDWLQSLGAPAGMKFFSGSCTRYYELIVTMESADLSRGQYSGYRRKVEMERTVYSNFPFPIPPLSFKPKPLSLSRVVNLAALLTTWLSGVKPDMRQ
jgi:hypothetical protein